MKSGSFIRGLVVSLFATALMGCATSVIKNGNYEGLKNSDPGKGTIFVYRESAFAGGANQYDVLVDDVLAGSLPNGSFFAVATEPGRKKIKADTGSFGKGSDIDVEKDKAYCLKLTLNFCLGCKSADVTPVDREQCDSEIKSLTRTRLSK